MPPEAESVEAAHNLDPVINVPEMPALDQAPAPSAAAIEPAETTRVVAAQEAVAAAPDVEASAPEQPRPEQTFYTNQHYWDIADAKALQQYYGSSKGIALGLKKARVTLFGHGKAPK